MFHLWQNLFIKLPTMSSLASQLLLDKPLPLSSMTRTAGGQQSLPGISLSPNDLNFSLHTCLTGSLATEPPQETHIQSCPALAEQFLKCCLYSGYNIGFSDLYMCLANHSSFSRLRCKYKWRETVITPTGE